MKTDDLETRIEETFAHIVGEMMRNMGIRSLVFSVGRDIVGTWAQGGPVKQKMARPVQWLLSKGGGKNGKARTWGVSSDMGRLLTLWARKVNLDHEQNPVSHVSSHTDAMRSFIESTDFGELAEMVQNSEECVVGTTVALNEQLWRFPAKIGNILLALIGVVNTAMRVTRETIRPIENNVSPDLLADMILSLMKGIRPRDMAELVNSSMELMRRIHTGSLLLGRAGKPLFQSYLTEILMESLPQIDSKILQKARIALAEDKVSVADALSEALRDNPDITLSHLASLGSIRTADAKAASRRLGILEGLDGTGLKNALSESVSSVDTYEIAELVNTACRVLGRIRDARPDLVSNLLSGIVDSVNPDEFRNIAQWLIPDVVEALKPLALEAMPILLKSLQDLGGGALDVQEGRLASGGEQ